jgi:hypothetical protein
MIRREDFAVIESESQSAENIQSISIQSLQSDSFLVPMLRKPDFQRETNHWTPEQIVTFLESFLDNELIPSLILWRSSNYVFVIDGGHRLSALRAWMEDDYGDGPVSIAYFSNEIAQSQKKAAKITRELVDGRVGRFSVLRGANRDPGSFNQQQVRRANNMGVRQLTLQWVSGDAEKAESSFFKINTQGTPLDETEETLLRNRSRTIAVAARSILRAGTGHKYWSKFANENRTSLEELSRKIHDLLLNPEISQPIKTLDIPVGGPKSPLLALNFLIRLISISNCSDAQSTHTPIENFAVDNTGEESIECLKICLNVVKRIAGNDAASLGLHPAIYFYSDRGRHLPDLLLGCLLWIRRKINNSDKLFFKKFTSVRQKFEQFMIDNKGLISQALQAAGSKSRFEKAATFFDELLNRLSDKKIMSEEDLFSIFVPYSQSRFVIIKEKSRSAGFSDTAKSAIFIKQALDSAISCKICGGKVDPARSISYDHVLRVREGGTGDPDNGQVTHPYCNTGYKA